MESGAYFRWAQAFRSDWSHFLDYLLDFQLIQFLNYFFFLFRVYIILRWSLTVRRLRARELFNIRHVSISFRVNGKYPDNEGFRT